MKGENTAIVLAAGQGKRMNSSVQKQFLEIGGKPLIYYSLKCFQESSLIRDIILVTGEEFVPYCKKEIVNKYGFTKIKRVIAGGKERYDSVYQGLLACEDSEYVLIHDGARQMCIRDRKLQCADPVFKRKIAGRGQNSGFFQRGRRLSPKTFFLSGTDQQGKSPGKTLSCIPGKRPEKRRKGIMQRQFENLPGSRDCMEK